MTNACEVCQELATNQVGDCEEIEPVCMDGQFFRKYRLVEKHHFCEKHVRTHICKPFFATTDDELRWLQAHRKAN